MNQGCESVRVREAVRPNLVRFAVTAMGKVRTGLPQVKEDRRTMWVGRFYRSNRNRPRFWPLA